MSLTSFTNEVGYHERTQAYTDYQFGDYYGSYIQHEITDSGFRTWEKSLKPSPTYGDHHRALDYSRQVMKIMKDEPAIWRRVKIETGNNKVIDLRGTDSMSKYFTLGANFPDNPGSDNAYSESITKALNKLASEDAGLGSDLGQARQTCDEFSHLVLRFGGALNALKRKNWKLAADNLIGLTGKHGTRSASRSAANLWLEYIYGVKPIMQDIYSLQKIVHQELNKGRLVEATARGISPYLFNREDSQTYQSGYNTFSARTVLRASLSNPCLYLLSEAGLVNPLSIAWDLVPWTFVFDWFAPVGATLQAITASCGLQYEGGWTSIHVDTGFYCKRKLTDPPQDYGWIDSGHYQEAGFAFTRYAHADFPIPRLYTDFTPFSTVRAVNALALVRQLV